MIGAKLVGADLSDATLSGADLTWTDLTGCTRPQNVAVPLDTSITFPIGTTTVTCTVHSIRAGSPSIGSGTFTFTVTVTVTVSDRSSSTGSLGSLSLFGS
ncbi:pentapeptide repeat-containing protein [Rhodococcus sp. ARC_M6]|nr:pentapeptide repeat-containing protein [Rhodococcus sp. ARC_M6]